MDWLKCSICLLYNWIKTFDVCVFSYDIKESKSFVAMVAFGYHVIESISIHEIILMGDDSNKSITICSFVIAFILI